MSFWNKLFGSKESKGSSTPVMDPPVAEATPETDIPAQNGEPEKQAE